MNKKLIYIISLMMVILFGYYAFGANASLTINFKNNSGSFSLYKLCNSDLSYTNSFKDLNIDLSQITTAQQLSSASKDIESYIKNANIISDYTQTGSNSICFNNLDRGVYFAMYNPSGSISMESFIVSIPTYNSVDNSYIFNVTANAKVKNLGGGGDGGDSSHNETTTERPAETTTAEITTDEATTEAVTKVEVTTMAVPPVNPPEEVEVTTGSLKDKIDGFNSDIVPEYVTDANGERVTTPDGEYVTEYHTESTTTLIDSDKSDNKGIVDNKENENKTTLPKTGGDKTVIICYYAGVVALILGVVILIINNKKNKRVEKL